MKRVIWLIIFGCFLFSGLACFFYFRASAGNPEPLVIRDVYYVPESTNPFQTLDLYIPQERKNRKTPLVVWIHGGAWISGDKNHPPAKELLDAGFAVASLNYRLSCHAPHPAQIHDCKAAIRFLKAHAAEYNIDPERIGAWGHSAGGHLVALLATSSDDKSLEGDLGNPQFTSRIQAACDWAGPTDLTTIAGQALPNSKIDFKAPGNVVEVLLGSEPAKDAAWKASPIAYLSTGDTPMLMIHGDADDVVPAEQSRELDMLAKKLGVADQECIIVRNEGHGIGSSMFAPTLAFLKKHLAR